METNFFGLGTCNASYNARRHYFIVFNAIICYNAASNDLLERIYNTIEMKIHYKDFATQLNTLLSSDQKVYLRVLADELNLDYDEVAKVHGFYQVDEVIKSPIYKTKEEVLSILVDVAILYIQLQRHENNRTGDEQLLSVLNWLSTSAFKATADISIDPRQLIEATLIALRDYPKLNDKGALKRAVARKL